MGREKLSKSSRKNRFKSNQAVKKAEITNGLRVKTGTDEKMGHRGFLFRLEGHVSSVRFSGERPTPLLLVAAGGGGSQQAPRRSSKN